MINSVGEKKSNYNDLNCIKIESKIEHKATKGNS